MPARVLLALGGDRTALAEALRRAGHALELCPPGRLAAALRSVGPAACVLELGARDWPAALPDPAADDSAPAVVVLVPIDRQELAARALELGADAVVPAQAGPDWVVAAVAAALARRVARRELHERRSDRRRRDEVVLAGRSPAVLRLAEGLERVASTPRTTVLVLGQPGCGSDAVARLVHERSSRSQGPLVEVPCGALEDAREAALLGTGPTGAHEGTSWLARADGGTLLLREVGRLGALGQQALTRALEPPGEEPGAPDARIVATSTLDLDLLVEQGRLREDLLYRLNVLTLRVPGLEERQEDLPDLAAALLETSPTASRGGPWRLDPRAGALLSRRAWPGGLIQLQLTLETAARLSPGPVLGPDALADPRGTPWPPAQPPAGPEAAVLAGEGTALSLPDRSLRSAEEALIRLVLVETGGNKLRSAEILGIHRTTLYHKLRDYGIEP